MSRKVRLVNMIVVLRSLSDSRMARFKILLPPSTPCAVARWEGRSVKRQDEEALSHQRFLRITSCVSNFFAEWTVGSGNSGNDALCLLCMMPMDPKNLKLHFMASTTQNIPLVYKRTWMSN